MSNTYKIIFSDSSHEQSGSEDSFAGGIPRLPVGSNIPVCDLCKSPQTFYFQLSCPSDSPWSGLSVAVFACTACADADHLIPQMLDDKLAGAIIPAGFLDNYQKNFRIIVFETSQSAPLEGYQEKILFQRLELISSSHHGTNGESKLGGTPEWVEDDETPTSYANDSRMFFLMQLQSDLRFKVAPSAPPQMELSLDGLPVPADSGFYQLFNGNTIYFFGTEGRDDPHVYVITQV